MHLDKAYNPEWVTYSVLSQLIPMPLAWDRTSLSQPAPKSDNGHLPDSTKSGAAAVYKFLDAQGKKPGSWVTSPLWQVVDGPFHLQSFSSDGRATLVPNSSYSGAPKPTISKLVELPFTSEAAIYNQEKSGGPNSITVGNVPSQYAPQLSSFASEGYTVNKAASYSFNYFPLNFNNPKVGPIFKQTYFREAFQHLIDQNGWIHAFLYNTANPTYGPIPFAPPSPLIDTSAIKKNPYAFSVPTAKSLLQSHGWKVVPDGQSTCVKPGSGAGECGPGIKTGQTIAFTVDYQSGVVAIQNEMNDLAAQARKVGITLSLTTHPFQAVVSAALPCKPSQAICKWEAENWGAGWIYGPAYLPTGEPLYNPGSAANAGSYSDPKMTRLIAATITGPASQESQALTNYANYVSQQVPVVFGPTSVGTYGGNAAQVIDSKLGGYAANAIGLMNPEDWYFTK
jgi:peptide/nickel transport system substrate-binding protein